MESLNNPDLTFRNPGERLMRRVQGDHDLRLDGISDLLTRARGASVFDVGCNRGRVADEFARNGAVRVAGCDVYADGIIAARHLFCDYRSVDHRFEVVDLTGGPDAVRKAFGPGADLKHDITMFLAVVHKLKRVMTQKALYDLLIFFAKNTKKYIGWRGHPEELAILDVVFERAAPFKRVHTSFISQIQPAAIWVRE